MILSWKHKGLERFSKTGNKSGILPAHEKRLKIILQRLNAAITANDMNTPGMDFHPLTGKLKGHYSVSVNGNWRVIFRFCDENVLDVNYIDYH
jgi:proteic killer suppression protein